MIGNDRGMLRGMYPTHPKNKQPHVSRRQGKCLDVKYLDIKVHPERVRVSQQVNRCAGVEGVGGGGNLGGLLYIYHPVKNTFQISDLRALFRYTLW